MNIEINESSRKEIGEDCTPPLSEICPVCQRQLGRFPYRWLVFEADTFLDKPEDWFVHPKCVKRLRHKKNRVRLQALIARLN